MLQGNSQNTKEKNAAIVQDFLEAMLNSDRFEYEYFLWGLSEVAYSSGFIKTGKALDEVVEMYFEENP